MKEISFDELKKREHKGWELLKSIGLQIPSAHLYPINERVYVLDREGNKVYEGDKVCFEIRHGGKQGRIVHRIEEIVKDIYRFLHPPLGTFVLVKRGLFLEEGIVICEK